MAHGATANFQWRKESCTHTTAGEGWKRREDKTHETQAHKCTASRVVRSKRVHEKRLHTQTKYGVVCDRPVLQCCSLPSPKTGEKKNASSPPNRNNASHHALQSITNHQPKRHNFHRSIPSPRRNTAMGKKRFTSYQTKINQPKRQKKSPHRIARGNYIARVSYHACTPVKQRKPEPAQISPTARHPFSTARRAIYLRPVVGGFDGELLSNHVDDEAGERDVEDFHAAVFSQRGEGGGCSIVPFRSVSCRVVSCPTRDGRGEDQVSFPQQEEKNAPGRGLRRARGVTRWRCLHPARIERGEGGGRQRAIAAGAKKKSLIIRSGDGGKGYKQCYCRQNRGRGRWEGSASPQTDYS